VFEIIYYWLVLKKIINMIYHTTSVSGCLQYNLNLYTKRLDFAIVHPPSIKIQVIERLPVPELPSPA
jgi:hypothetical protein